MRSKWTGIVALSAALSMLSGCAFTQWTDHAFLGSPQDPPLHADREWAGAVILPFAVTGDIVTAPIQLIVLLIRGDYGIYEPRSYDGGRAGLDTESQDVLASGADAGRLVREVEARLSGRHDGMLPGFSPLTAWGLDGQGNVVEVPLTAAQHDRLVARAASSGRHVRLAIN